MALTEFAWYIILILLPGIINLIIIRYLTIQKEVNNFLFFINAVILGFFSYLILEGILFIYNSVFSTAKSFGSNLVIWQSIVNKSDSLPANELFWAIITTIPLALIISSAIQNKWIIKFAQKLGITNKFGDDDVWSYFLNSEDLYWVWIRDIGRNLIYYGWVNSYSGSEKKREILISDVSVFSDLKNGETEELYQIDSLYLDLDKMNYIIEVATEQNEKSN